MSLVQLRRMVVEIKKVPPTEDPLAEIHLPEDSRILHVESIRCTPLAGRKTQDWTIVLWTEWRAPDPVGPPPVDVGQWPFEVT